MHLSSLGPVSCAFPSRVPSEVRRWGELQWLRAWRRAARLSPSWIVSGLTAGAAVVAWQLRHPLLAGHIFSFPVLTSHLICHGLKQQQSFIISHDFCGSRFPEWLGEAVLALRSLLGRASTGATGCACMVTLSLGCKAGQPQDLCTWASTRGCSSVLTTWRLASLRASDPGERSRAAVYFMIQPWKPHTTMFTVFCWSHRLAQGRRGQHKGVDSRRQGS